MMAANTHAPFVSERAKRTYALLEQLVDDPTFTEWRHENGSIRLDLKSIPEDRRPEPLKSLITELQSASNNHDTAAHMGGSLLFLSSPTQYVVYPEPPRFPWQRPTKPDVRSFESELSDRLCHNVRQATRAVLADDDAIARFDYYTNPRVTLNLETEQNPNILALFEAVEKAGELRSGAGLASTFAESKRQTILINDLPEASELTDKIYARAADLLSAHLHSLRTPPHGDDRLWVAADGSLSMAVSDLPEGFQHAFQTSLHWSRTKYSSQSGGIVTTGSTHHTPDTLRVDGRFNEPFDVGRQDTVYRKGQVHHHEPGRLNQLLVPNEVHIVGDRLVVAAGSPIIDEITQFQGIHGAHDLNTAARQLGANTLEQAGFINRQQGRTHTLTFHAETTDALPHVTQNAMRTLQQLQREGSIPDHHLRTEATEGAIRISVSEDALLALGNAATDQRKGVADLKPYFSGLQSSQIPNVISR